MHLCAELTAAFRTLEPFGEIGAYFSLQLSSRTRFDKINKKKVIAENQCEKHKKSSLICSVLLSFQNETCLCKRFTMFVTKYNLMSKDNLIVPILEDQQLIEGESEA